MTLKTEPQNINQIKEITNKFLLDNTKVIKDQEIAKKAFLTLKGKNFMTKEILFYCTISFIKKVYCEVSFGRFLDHYIYGITIRQEINDQLETTKYSQCFHSINEAFNYLLELIENKIKLFY